MTTPLETHPGSQGADFRKPLYDEASRRYGITEKDGRVMLPESMRPLFLGEESVEKPPTMGAGNDFFWHRLAEYVSTAEPMYYRFSIEPAMIPRELEGFPMNEPLLLVWMRVQFEAHRLIEHPLAVALGRDRAEKIPLSLLLDDPLLVTPAKIYVTPQMLEERMALLHSSICVLMAEEIATIQAAMLKTLHEETERIREYYSHLLVKTQKSDEKDRLRREQKFLEQEHNRRLHPAALKILVVPELIASLIVQ
ncbi:hypothetical protein KKF84_18050 [Myxococcota bacterium]|nr:hypothetical protein [Myxococcota bacterium]MBU1537225.1 hypothetical protein [Myxococcota bacterium]